MTTTRIHRVPRPESEPPYDDTGAGPAPPRPPTQGALALDFTLPSGVPAVPQPEARLRLVGPRETADDDLGLGLAALTARRPTSSADLPEPRRWAARLAQAVVETLHGQRPLQQLLRWTDDAVYEQLGHRLAGRSRPAVASRPRIRSIRVCSPTDGVAEASVVVQTGSRCRALALRLEGLDGRWLCTALDII